MSPWGSTRAISLWRRTSGTEIPVRPCRHQLVDGLPTRYLAQAEADIQETRPSYESARQQDDSLVSRLSI
jgi:hypothetical protein